MASPATIPILPALKTVCSSCSLRELCLPFGVEAGDLARLDQVIERRQRLKSGRHLYRVGDRFSSLYAIRSGFVKTCELTADGQELVNGFHMTGEILGLDAISSERHACNAVALEDCELCVIPFSQLEDLLREIPSLMQQFHRVMSREIASDHGMMLLLGTMTAEQKLGSFLLNLSQRLGARGLSPTQIRLSMSREDIGNYLGLKLETVSRTFSKLQQDGIITVDRRNLSVIDLDALRRLTGCASASGTA